MEKIDNNIIHALKQKPERFSMSVLLFCCVKINNKYYLPAQTTNPAWKTYFPFHDNVNKNFVLKDATSQTFSEIIEEIDSTFAQNISDSLNKAINHFENLFGCTCKIKKSKKESLYEIKTSLSTKKLTAYKFYNYIITSVSDTKNFADIIKTKYKLFDIDDLEKDNNLVSNAILFVKAAKTELKRNAIKL